MKQSLTIIIIITTTTTTTTTTTSRNSIEQNPEELFKQERIICNLIINPVVVFAINNTKIYNNL